MDVLSYGAGVQTFGILCLIRLNELPKPDLLIFADTQGESHETYVFNEEFAKPLASELGIPWVTVTRGSLLTDSLLRGNTPKPPLCSWMYKRDVINAYIRKEGLVPANVWIGISTDELERGYKKSAVSWVTNYYPLLENDYSRHQVIEAIKLAGMPIPQKSGCWFCRWRGQAYWLNFKQREPELFKLALNLEKATGHRLAKSNFWLSQIEGQASFDDLVECTGFCDLESEA